MDWKTFVAEMTKALAWPSLIVFIVVRYHAPILELLKKLSKAAKAKGFGMEFDFEREAEEVAKVAAELREPSTSPTATAVATVEADVGNNGPVDIGNGEVTRLNNAQQRLRRYATEASHMAPKDFYRARGLILDVWLTIEDVLAQLADLQSASLDLKKNNALTLMKSLSTRGILNNKEFELLVALRRLRNEATHEEGFVIPKQGVEYFIESASTIVDAISERWNLA